MRTCTGVAVGSSIPAHKGGAANVPVCRSEFAVRSKRKAFGGAVEVHLGHWKRLC